MLERVVACNTAEIIFQSSSHLLSDSKHKATVAFAVLPIASPESQAGLLI